MWAGMDAELRKGVNTIREMVARRHQSPTKEWPLVFGGVRRAARDSRMAGRDDHGVHDVAKFERQSGRPLKSGERLHDEPRFHIDVAAQGAIRQTAARRRCLKAAGPAPRRIPLRACASRGLGAP